VPAFQSFRREVGRALGGTQALRDEYQPALIRGYVRITHGTHGIVQVDQKREHLPFFQPEEPENAFISPSRNTSPERISFGK
jgi:hypothetical protein